MDEILSCWVIVARLGLDPWGHPVSGEATQRAAVRHRDAQRLIGALVFDAGFDVRLGLYRLPEDCYGFSATCEALVDRSERADRAPDEPVARGGAEERESGSEKPHEQDHHDDAAGGVQDA